MEEFFVPVDLGGNTFSMLDTYAEVRSHTYTQTLSRLSLPFSSLINSKEFQLSPVSIQKACRGSLSKSAVKICISGLSPHMSKIVNPLVKSDFGNFIEFPFLGRNFNSQMDRLDPFVRNTHL